MAEGDARREAWARTRARSSLAAPQRRWCSPTRRGGPISAPTPACAARGARTRARRQRGLAALPDFAEGVSCVVGEKRGAAAGMGARFGGGGRGGSGRTVVARPDEAGAAHGEPVKLDSQSHSVGTMEGADVYHINSALHVHVPYLSTVGFLSGTSRIQGGRRSRRTLPPRTAASQPGAALPRTRLAVSIGQGDHAGYRTSRPLLHGARYQRGHASGHRVSCSARTAAMGILHWQRR